MKLFVSRTFLAVALAAVLALTARAQPSYPNQGIRLIVPYAPGGLPDTVARIVGQHLQERVGQSVVVENRPGGGAAAAVSALMGAPADGYTFLVTDGGIVSTNPALVKQLTYNPKDIVPLALLGRAPMFLAAHPGLPVSTRCSRPIHRWRARPKGKKVKLLAQNGQGRWFQAPEVPAVSELVPNFDLATIVALFARPGLPQAIAERITVEAITAANSPTAERQLRAAGIEPAGGDAEVLGKALKHEIDKVNEVVKNAGIEPQ